MEIFSFTMYEIYANPVDICDIVSTVESRAIRAIFA